MRKKPLALKMLQGNPGRRPIVDEPPIVCGPLTVPDGLSPPVLDEWSRIVASAPVGLLTSADSNTLRAFAEACAAHRHAATEIAKNGYLVPARKTGTPVVNPYWPIMNRAASIMARLGDALGLTPSGRSRLRAPTPSDGGDPFVAYLREINQTKTAPENSSGRKESAAAKARREADAKARIEADRLDLLKRGRTEEEAAAEAEYLEFRRGGR